YLSQARFGEARAVLEGGASAGYSKLLLGLMDYWLDGNLDIAIRQLQDAPEGAHAISEMLQDAGGRQAAGSVASDTLGRAYQALGLYAQADAEFRRVADPIGHYDLGELRLEEGQPQPALAQLRQAVQSIPNQEDFRLALARLYLHTGSMDQAKREYRVVLELNPGNVEARRALA
ncbi:MAG: tetratricopeptide repeat protein, partial [Chloroflexota bacterium]